MYLQVCSLPAQEVMILFYFFLYISFQIHWYYVVCTDININLHNTIVGILIRTMIIIYYCSGKEELFLGLLSHANCRCKGCQSHFMVALGSKHFASPYIGIAVILKAGAHFIKKSRYGHESLAIFASPKRKERIIREIEPSQHHPWKPRLFMC